MKTIMLVCNAGMSTSMLVTKMKTAAAKQGLDVAIFAVPVSETETTIANQTIDVLLLGPQVKFLLQDFKIKYEPKIKVAVISMQDYGVMNGQKVLSGALELLSE
ncbi:PTS sugar transporter subunit IIB [Streptococcus halichoeri]|uniref:PTS sugar transporter subunit IIB n=1 Tax=Streptococcus halichoeri TaxID=254785 RepID=UPI00135B07E3|nr:PTS sugar transporter subunit IIB [Streptococcus halichoeri]